LSVVSGLREVTTGIRVTGIRGGPVPEPDRTSPDLVVGARARVVPRPDTSPLHAAPRSQARTHRCERRSRPRTGWRRRGL